MTDDLRSIEEPHGRELAVPIGVEVRGRDRWEVEDCLDELAELGRSAGVEILPPVIVRRPRLDPAHFIGSGKAREIAQSAKELGATVALFDDDLSPAQKRNLEKAFGIKVLDRTEVVLDIFAQRARTRAGQLQIELAQLQYLLPRLTRLWTHLSRQQGGIGTRGPGETQLEVDRRRIQDRIRTLRHRLDEVRSRRRVVRESRRRRGHPVASLVGYTNAGKSTLLNALTEAEVPAEDKLFATLDPTTRAIRCEGNETLLLTDTVGFLRKLPTHLIEAFHATLEEVIEADLLVHVVDASHPRMGEQVRAVDEVLAQLGVADSPRLTVFNKVDRIDPPDRIERLLDEHPGSIAISATRRQGLDDLVAGIRVLLSGRRVRVRLEISAGDGAALARVRGSGQILSEEYEGDIARIDALVPRSMLGVLSPFVRDAGRDPEARPIGDLAGAGR